MIEIYQKNGDIHAMTTSIIFGISLEEAMDKRSAHYKELRSVAKETNFGVLYGLYARSLKEILSENGIEKTLDECKTIIDTMKKGYMGLAVWQNKIVKETEKKKYTESYMGRRRYLSDIASTEFAKKSTAERQALNHPIQSTAAEIMKLSMIRILNGLQTRRWLKPILQIHDEIVFSVPEDKLGEAISFVRGCMEEKPFVDFDIPLIAEASVGKRFGSMAEID
jgi:DNA polymerase-1